MVAKHLSERLRGATLAASLLTAGVGAGAQTASGSASALPASGFVLITPDGQTHVHLSRPLAAKERLWVQWPNRAGQPSCCRRLSAHALKPVPAPPQNETNADQEQAPVLMSLDGSTPVHYRLPTPQERVDGGFVGMALAAPRVHAQGQHALRAAPDTRIRMCAGTEGLNLLTQAGQRRQVLYLSLGYPIDSTQPCTPQDEAFIRSAGS